ncbi:MAG: ABC transporter ATP-binding protein [Candidatus Electrothrix sp. AUS3]|nr:ABC transporter ATP-binding protein [Candidatus Electrothrix gigas]
MVEKQVVHALKKVDLRIPSGKIVSVTGKSGAGKSTLLHLIGALDKPTTGSVLLNGTDVSKVDDQTASSFRNKTIGFVFQMNNLLPEFSAIENVVMPGLIAGVKKAPVQERAKMLLDAVGLGEQLNHRPGELSGGEQQRVTIARALLMAPPILLADEPTGNLDNKTSLEIQDLLFKLAEQYKMTMLQITHDAELAARLPSQIIMEDGCIKEEGNLC